MLPLYLAGSLWPHQLWFGQMSSDAPSKRLLSCNYLGLSLPLNVWSVCCVG